MASAHLSTADGSTAQGHFSPPFSTAPDSIFAAVLFAASAMVIVRYTVVCQFQRKRSITWFTTGTLLTKLADTLDALAVSDEHAPRRAAAVARELKRVWHEKVTSEVAVEGPYMGWLRKPAEPLSSSRTGYSDDEPVSSVPTQQIPAIGTPDSSSHQTNPKQSAMFNDWAFDTAGSQDQGPPPGSSQFGMGLPTSYLPYNLGPTAALETPNFDGFVEEDFWASFMGTFGSSNV